ncbi:hypothetical protein CMI37_24325 [Candidatus Pacearchaeota archaeon]|nr:hypothetical protein [Candidatus Pacearchaeota archaeon]|tara:strand:- start:5528 stop:6346 length:819 start_codon:yes stop_codon:yes gene_type:complete
MKLTIYLTANEEYLYFVEVFLFSIRENFPQEKLKKIIINDLGFTFNQRVMLKKIHPLVEFISTTKTKVRLDQVWGEGWRLAISNKTEGLYSICNEENYPIVMIDVDTFVLKDFSDEIFYGCDVQVCQQAPFRNEAGQLIDYIGCWFVAHNDKAKEFIHRWVHKINQSRWVHKETPGLCDLMDQLKKSDNTHFTVKENHENDICALDYNPAGKEWDKPKILHFRSNPKCINISKTGEEEFTNVSVNDSFYLDRINETKNLPNEIRRLYYKIIL